MEPRCLVTIRGRQREMECHGCVGHTTASGDCVPLLDLCELFERPAVGNSGAGLHIR